MLRSVPPRQWNETSAPQPERGGERFDVTTTARGTALQRHRIARFDTLSEISKQYYGTREHALLIFEANRDALVNPQILPLGLELVIPEKPSVASSFDGRPIPPTPNRRQSRLSDSASQLLAVPANSHQPAPRSKLPASPIENQYGWRRAPDDRDWRRD